MYRKTVLRRLCKLIELDFETIEQAKTFEESSDMQFKKDDKEKEKSAFEEVKDVEFKEVKEEKQESIFEGTPFESGED